MSEYNPLSDKEKEDIVWLREHDVIVVAKVRGGDGADPPPPPPPVHPWVRSKAVTRTFAIIDGALYMVNPRDGNIFTAGDKFQVGTPEKWDNDAGHQGHFLKVMNGGPHPEFNGRYVRDSDVTYVVD